MPSQKSFDFSEAEANLGRIKFTQGKFMLFPGEYRQSGLLRLVVDAEDSFNPGNRIEVSSKCDVYYSDIDAMTEACWYLLTSYAQHEMGERLYVDGKLPYNEHNSD